jgi:hypothetical protein
MSRLAGRNLKRMKLLLVIAFLATSVAILSSVAIGSPPYKDSLPDAGGNYDCAYCHVTVGGDLTPFGEDFEQNGNVYDDTLAAVDSDDDGFTNEEEFSADPVSNPGDPDSYPGGDVTPPEKPDMTPWVLTTLAGVIAIVDISLILILVVIRKRPEKKVNA